MANFSIDRKDDALDILDKVNKALAEVSAGWRFEDDGERHDGFVLIHLVQVPAEPRQEK